LVKKMGEWEMNYCVQCGAQLPSGSRFCGSCGKSVAQGDNLVPLNFDGTTKDVNKSKPWRLPEVLFLLGCVGAFAGVLLPLIAHLTPTQDAAIDHQKVAHGILAFGICTYLLVVRRGWPRPWMTALAGSAFLFLIASIAIGVARFRQEEVQHTPISKLLSSLKTFDPITAERFLKKDVKKEETKQLLREAFQRAVRQAPDEAVIQYNDIRLRVFATGAHASWCRTTAYQEIALIINDGWQDVPKSNVQHESVRTTAAEQQIILEAMADLFDTAALNTGKGIAVEQAPIEQLMQRVRAKADPLNLYSSTAQLDELSPSKICGLHKTFMSSIHTLRPTEAARILRYMATFD
jgi:hypothetical protein